MIDPQPLPDLLADPSRRGGMVARALGEVATEPPVVAPPLRLNVPPNSSGGGHLGVSMRMIRRVVEITARYAEIRAQLERRAQARRLGGAGGEGAAGVEPGPAQLAIEAYALLALIAVVCAFATFAVLRIVAAFLAAVTRSSLGREKSWRSCATFVHAFDFVRA